METKELKIQIPEGYEIDKEKSSFENIVFKKKNSKPRSWKEYSEQQRNKTHFVLGYDVVGGYSSRRGIYESGYCTVPSKELAEAFLAMMQIMSLRQAWIGDWNSNQLGYAIMLDVQRNIMVSHDVYPKALIFPDRNMAVDFMNTFKDLLEIAKPLI